MLVPALSRAGRDEALGELDESGMAFILRVIGEILDDLEMTADIGVEDPQPVERRGSRAGQWESRGTTIRKPRA